MNPLRMTVFLAAILALPWSPALAGDLFISGDLSDKEPQIYIDGVRADPNADVLTVMSADPTKPVAGLDAIVLQLADRNAAGELTTRAANLEIFVDLDRGVGRVTLDVVKTTDQGEDVLFNYEIIGDAGSFTDLNLPASPENQAILNGVPAEVLRDMDQFSYKIAGRGSGVFVLRAERNGIAFEPDHAIYTRGVESCVDVMFHVEPAMKSGRIEAVNGFCLGNCSVGRLATFCGPLCEPDEDESAGAD